MQWLRPIWRPIPTNTPAGRSVSRARGSQRSRWVSSTYADCHSSCSEIRRLLAPTGSTGIEIALCASYRAGAQWRHPRGFLGDHAGLSAETAETLHDFMLDWFRLDAGPQLATATVTPSTCGFTPATARSSSSSCPAL